MVELYSTSLDVLYLVLTIVIGVLGLFLIVAVYHLIRTLSNFNKVSAKARDTIDLINHILWQPIKIAMMILEKTKKTKKKSK